MNVNTGHIRMVPAGEEPGADEVAVDLEEATPRQKREMKVSPFDNRSPLGRKRVYEAATRNQKKRMRKRARKEYGA